LRWAVQNPESGEQSAGEENPWLRMAGMWDKDDPLVQEWERIMNEERRKADADPDYL
jgi:hypothetical protein